MSTAPVATPVTPPPSKPSGNGPGGRPFTKEIYDALVAQFRVAPGDIPAAVRVVGVDSRTARRTWAGPPRQHHPWAVPVQGMLAAEAAAERQRVEDERNRITLALEEERKAKLKLAEELRQVDENIMRVGRTNVLRGLMTGLRMTEGMEALAKRVNEQLVRGTDAKGVALPVDVEKSLRVLHRFSTSNKNLVETAKVMFDLDRLKEGLPTTIVGVQAGVHVTLEQAEREVREAFEAIEEAKQRGWLVPRLPVGGGPAPGREVIDASDEDEDDP